MPLYRVTKIEPKKEPPSLMDDAVFLFLSALFIVLLLRILGVI